MSADIVNNIMFKKSIQARKTNYYIKRFLFKCTLLYCYSFFGQQNIIKTKIARDRFTSVITDARATGQGDIGVATSTDAFSQSWNPSKHLFSNKKAEVGFTHVFGRINDFKDFNQLNVNFYSNLNDRSALGFSLKGYAYKVNRADQFNSLATSQEISIDGSYTLRLSSELAMSVGARFISLKGKLPLLERFSDVASSELYGIDISGFYYGKEIAFGKFNGRYRAGFLFSNLRGEALSDDKYIEIYAPSTLKAGAGFDFIIRHDRVLGITAEYKTLLDSYIEDTNGEKLDYILEGSVAAAGLEFTYNEKLVARAGYSYGINRSTDSFSSVGGGLKTKYLDIDIALLLGVSREENPTRENLRLSLTANLANIFLR